MKQPPLKLKNLPASAAIYDTLVHYKSLVPADNQAFQTFAFNWWRHQPSIKGYWTEREHARQWDDEILWDSQVLPNGGMYDESFFARIQAVVDKLIDLYFPEGPPLYSVDAGNDMITWSGQAVPLAPTVVNNTEPYTALTYAWSADPTDGVILLNPGVENPTVTITKAVIGDALTVTSTLAVHDGIHPTLQDTMTITVYDNACLATLFGFGLTGDHPTNLDVNCTTDFRDFAVIATKWLNHTGLTGPAAK